MNTYRQLDKLEEKVKTTKDYVDAIFKNGDSARFEYGKSDWGNYKTAAVYLNNDRHAGQEFESLESLAKYLKDKGLMESINE